jgi:hypothetical protein
MLLMISLFPDTRRVRVEERDVVGDCPFDPARLDGEMVKIAPAESCAFPCNGGDIRRGRKQLFHNRLAPALDH